MQEYPPPLGQSQQHSQYQPGMQYQEQVCRTSPAFLILILIFFGIVIPYTFGTFFFLLYLALFFFLLVTALTVKIRLTPDGITIHGLGYNAYAPWQSLASETSHFIYPGVTLHSAAVTSMSVEEGRIRGIPVIQANPIVQLFVGSSLTRIMFVPAITGRNWRRSRVGLYMRQYAPWI